MHSFVENSISAPFSSSSLASDCKSFTINDDQKRVLSPKDAVKFGANFLVIGRPITQSKNPLETIKNINQSIQ